MIRALFFLCLISLHLLAGIKEDFFNQSITDKDFIKTHLKFKKRKAEQILSQMMAKTHSLKFTIKGSVSSFKYQATSYTGEHEIIYYIPENLDLKKPQKLMILLHGGGASTATYASAADIAKGYVESNKTLADELGFIIIAPSSQYGWGYIVRVLVNETLLLAKTELNINSNHVFLYGHSMGGMGITRDGHYLADKMSFIMPSSAGMPESYQTREHLLTYFNTPFIHVNGKKDHYADFVIRANQVKTKVSLLENELKTPSKYQLHFHPGGHNPDKILKKKLIESALKNPRNLYQKQIYPIFQDLMTLDNQWKVPPVTHKLIDNGFWIDVLNRETQNDRPTTYYSQAKINGQTISIDIDQGISKIRIYLSKKLVDFSKEVSIQINGKIHKNYQPNINTLKTIETARIKSDPLFIFEDYLDLEI
jgi:predicted esterase